MAHLLRAAARFCAAYFARLLDSSSRYKSAGLGPLAAISSISADTAIKRLPAWAFGDESAVRAFRFAPDMVTSLYLFKSHQYRHAATISILSFGLTETIYDKKVTD
ncbi:hypothetical protein ACX3YC_21265 [Pseudomonas mohnii]|jgi:hypothetical protein|uniref:hypothetical protein n=1 Tax=Pseudomonas TaxID=286 RepID=UPI001028B3EB|nr:MULTISPECIES: hypothetical protein [Pseudomonas]MBH8611339.1 hypothetical protein [Pseudomonas mohnii]MBM6442227.1 hypothetical protein [Pseudomonas sp. MIL9]RZO09451.1 hypothetical protein EKG40_08355 [Pseudomonas moorei]